MLYNSVKGINGLLLRITGQIFLSGKLCLYCKSMALILCTHSNMLTFIALFTPGSKSVIRSGWADNQCKLVTAPGCSEAVGWMVLLVGCEMKKVKDSHCWGRDLYLGQAWGQWCWHIPHEFPCAFNRGLAFSQFISWREAFIAGILVKKEIFFACLRTNCKVISNHILFVCKSHSNKHQHSQLFDLH